MRGLQFCVANDGDTGPHFIINKDGLGPVRRLFPLAIIMYSYPELCTDLLLLVDRT